MNKNQEELELEKILKQIEQDERLRDVTVPERVTRNIFAQIHAMEQAIAEIEPIEITMAEAENLQEVNDTEVESLQEVSHTKASNTKVIEASLEEQFHRMTEEEKASFQEFLALKKEQRTKEETQDSQPEDNTPEDNIVPITTKKTRKRSKKTKKVLFLVAAVATLTLGTGIVGVGTDYKWLQLGDKELSNDIMIAINSEDDIMINNELEEKEAYEYAKEVLGSPVAMLVRPDDTMKFDSIHVNQEMGVTMFYMNGEASIMYNIVQNKNKLSHFEYLTGELKEEYIVEYTGVEFVVQKYIELDGSELVNVNFTYNNLFYSIAGVMQKEEMEEILQNIMFF